MVFHDNVDVGLVGEIDVRRELAAEGWLTINTNTEKGNFPNVDLIAVKQDHVRHIQVKTTNGEVGSHKHCLYMGRAEKWLRRNERFYNNANGPLSAQFIILVHAMRNKSRFVILPVILAERIARTHVDGWYAIPKDTGEQRSPGFDARPDFIRLREVKSRKSAETQAAVDKFKYESKRIQETFFEYENRWDLLDVPIEDLMNEECWKFS